MYEEKHTWQELGIVQEENIAEKGGEKEIIISKS